MISIETLEGKIVSIARRYARNAEEVQDFAQLGRIAVWNINEKRENVPESYYVQSIKYAMFGELKKSKAQKRIPLESLSSLDAPFEEGEDGSLYDVLGEEDTKFEDIDTIKVFHDLLRKKFGKFYVRGKRGILSQRNSEKVANKIIQTSIEEVARIPKKDVPVKANSRFFRNLGLHVLLANFYQDSAMNAVQAVYPDEFQPWEFNRSPLGYWSGDNGAQNGINAIKWFCKKRNIKKLADCRGVTRRAFREDGLGGLLSMQFRSSPFLALRTQFSELKPKDCNTRPKGYWDSEENQKTELISFLIEHQRQDISGLTPEATYDLGLKKFVNSSALISFGLSCLLNHNYSGQIYELFHHHFPKQILPWTLTSRWTDNPKEIAGKAVRWLFDKYLQIPQDEINSYASYKLFAQVGFGGYLSNPRLFNGSVFKFVDNAYPGVFSQSDFSRYRKIKRHPLRK
ncbi:MAG: hypothetical protein AABX11_05030 [Nanoarchaeota archaeon]